MTKNFKVRSGRFAGAEGRETASNAGTVTLALTNGETTTEYWPNVIRLTQRNPPC